jgi:hypothetical protein
MEIEMSREQGQAHLDTYWRRCTATWRPFRGRARETLAELRSHVLDRTEGQLSPAAVEAAIAALGSPRDVARLNVTERVASALEADRSAAQRPARDRTAGEPQPHGFMVLPWSRSPATLLAAGFLVTAWSSLRAEPRRDCGVLPV